MLINALDPEESRIAAVEDGVLQELHVEIASREAYLGNIYKGRVVNIEPSIGAAFVNFGGKMNGFLHASDVLPAYGRDDFRLADVVEGRARVSGEEGPDVVRAVMADDEDGDANGDDAESSAAADRSDARLVEEEEEEEEEEDEEDGAGDASLDEAEDPDDVEDGDVESREEDERQDAIAAAEPGDREDDVAGEGVHATRADEDREEGDRQDREDREDRERDAGESAPRSSGGKEGESGGGRRRRNRRNRRGRQAAAASVDADFGSYARAEGPGGGEVAGGETGAGAPAGADDEFGASLGGEDEPRSGGRSGRAPRTAAGEAAPIEDGDGFDAGGAPRDDDAEANPGRADDPADAPADAPADDPADDPADEAPPPPRTRRPRGQGRGETRGSGGGSGGGGSFAMAAAPSGEEQTGAVAVEAVKRRRGRRGRPHGERTPRPRIPIDQLLKKGQEVVVQIIKEGIGAKGPTLTTYISLPGRSLVLMPSLPKCGVSRKIDDERERRRLKKIVRELDETGNGGIGFIVRTAGIGKSKADLERDRDYLKKIWEVVAQRAKTLRAPALLYEESDLVLKAMRDLFSPDIDEVVVDSHDVYLRIKDFADKLMPRMAERIKLHELSSPLFHSFGIEKELESLYQPRVEMPHGGSIVIDQTEALVAIDVNSGRYKPGTDLEETAYRTNLQAIPEIVRQLRLRDLGGLIIIDFIDMSSEKHRRGVERALMDALRGDRARIKVGKISPFGMLEITRQRVGPGLKHTVFMQCPHCKGSGLVRTVQSKALAVLRDVRALVHLKGFSILQAFVAPPVNDFLVNYKRRALLDLEEVVGKTVLFKAEPSYPVDVVHYRFLTADGQEARVAIPAGLGVKV